MTNTCSTTFSRIAFSVLALLTMAAAYNVALVQAQDTTSTRVLIQTVCKLGTVNVCGEEPAHTECTRTWKLDLGWLTKQFGVGIGEVTCVQVGKLTLYKDFYRSSSGGGACGINNTSPFFPTTVISPDEEPMTGEAGTC